MASIAGFNAAAHKDMSTFDVLPISKQPAMIVDSEMKPTSDSSGSYLQLKFEVYDGEFKGRNLWSRLNVVNKSKEAQDLAYRELATICRACGKPGEVSDSAELHNIPIILDLDVVPQTEGRGKDRKVIPGKFQNKIKTYLPLSAGLGSAAAPVATPGAPAAGPAAPAPVAATPPWAKKP